MASSVSPKPKRYQNSQGSDKCGRLNSKVSLQSQEFSIGALPQHQLSYNLEKNTIIDIEDKLERTGDYHDPVIPIQEKII